MGDNLYRGATVPDTYWRLRSYTLDPQAKVVRNLTRFTPKLYAPYAKTMCDTLNVDTSFTNPYADGQPFTGTFYGVARTQGIGEDDRSLTIVQTLVPNKGEDKSVTWAENCKEMRTIRVVEKMTKAQLDVEAATYAACSNGHNYMLDINRDEDGLWTMKVMIREAQWITQTAFTSEKSALGEQETYREINKQTQSFDLTRAQGEIIVAASTLNEFCYYDLERRKNVSYEASLQFASRRATLVDENSIEYENSRTKIDSPAAGQSGIYSADQRINPDGTYNGKLAYQQNLAAEVTVTSGTATLRTDTSLLFKNRTSAVTVPAAAQGKIYRADQTENIDGTFDGRMELNTAVADSATFNAESTVGHSTVQTVARNRTTPIAVGAATAGQTYRAGNQENVDGTFDGNLSLETAINHSASGARLSAALASESELIDMNRGSILAASAATQGTVYQASNELKDDGTFNSRLLYRQSAAGEVSLTTEATPFRVGQRVVYENSRTVISVTAPASGVYRADLAINQDGTYNGAMTYIHGTGGGEAQHESLNSNLGEGSRVIYRDWPTPVSAPASAQGVIYDAQDRLNDDGMYEASIEYRTSHVGQVAFKAEAAPFRTANRVIYANSRDVIQATVPAVGIYRVDQTVNQDGTYNGGMTYVVGTGGGEAQFESVNSNLAEESRVIYRDWPAVIVAPASGQGTVYEAQDALGEDGLYEASITYRVNHVGVITFQSESTIFRTGNSVVYHHSKSVIQAPTSVAPGLYRVSQSINPDGTYDGTLQYLRPSGTGEATFVSEVAQLSTQSAVIYAAGSTAVDAPTTGGQGTVYRTSNRLNDDGTYDSNLAYDLSTSASMTFSSERAEFKTENRIVYANSRTVIQAPDMTGPGLYAANQTVNQDGTYNGALIYRATAGTGAVRFAATTSTLEDQVRVVYKSRDAAVVASASGTGTIYQAANQINEDGSYDATFTYSASHPATTVFTRHAALLETQDAAIYRNLASPATVGTAAIGQTYQLSQNQNTDGTFDGQLTYQVRVGATPTFDSLHSTLSDQTAIIYRAHNTNIVAPVSAQGQIYHVSETLEADGTYEGRLNYDTSNAVSFQFATVRTAASDTNAIVYENSRTVIEAPAPGDAGNYRVTQRVNQDGTYSGNLTYDTNLGRWWFSHKYRWVVYDPIWELNVLYKEVYCQNCINCDEAEDFLNEAGDPNLRGTEMHMMDDQKWIAVRVRKTTP